MGIFHHILTDNCITIFPWSNFILNINEWPTMHNLLFWSKQSFQSVTASKENWSHIWYNHGIWTRCIGKNPGSTVRNVTMDKDLSEASTYTAEGCLAVWMWSQMSRKSSVHCARCTIVGLPQLLALPTTHCSWRGLLQKLQPCTVPFLH